ncbi:unnamed protein product [Somion occarium]
MSYTACTGLFARACAFVASQIFSSSSSYSDSSLISESAPSLMKESLLATSSLPLQPTSTYYAIPTNTFSIYATVALALGISILLPLLIFTKQVKSQTVMNSMVFVILATIATSVNFSLDATDAAFWSLRLAVHDILELASDMYNEFASFFAIATTYPYLRWLPPTISVFNGCTRWYGLYVSCSTFLNYGSRPDVNENNHASKTYEDIAEALSYATRDIEVDATKGLLDANEGANQSTSEDVSPSYEASTETISGEVSDDQLVSHHATQGVKVDSTTEELLSTDEGATQSTSEDVSPSKVVTESGPSKALARRIKKCPKVSGGPKNAARPRAGHTQADRESFQLLLNNIRTKGTRRERAKEGINASTDQTDNVSGSLLAPTPQNVDRLVTPVSLAPIVERPGVSPREGTVKPTGKQTIHDQSSANTSKLPSIPKETPATQVSSPGKVVESTADAVGPKDGGEPSLQQETSSPAGAHPEILEVINQSHRTNTRNWRAAVGVEPEEPASLPSRPQEPVVTLPPLRVRRVGRGPPVAPPVGSFHTSRKIGEGAYGTVYAYHYPHTNFKLAVKKFKSDQAHWGLHEAGILKLVNERNKDGHGVVKVYDWYQQGDIVSIRMELLGPDLCTYSMDVAAKGFKISKKDMQSFTYQLTDVFDFLHGIGVIHGDVKPLNIALLYDDWHEDVHESYKNPDGTVVRFARLRRPILQVYDFGLSTGNLGPHTSAYSTILYDAPEVLLGQDWSLGRDVWAVGVTLLELHVGQNPLDVKRWSPAYDVPEQLQVMERVFCKLPANLAEDGARVKPDWFDERHYLKCTLPTEARRSFRGLETYFRLDDYMESRLYNFIHTLLDMDPKSRPTMKEALNFPFIKDLAKRGLKAIQ